MCLIFVAWRAHPRYRLVVAANRDEFHARPTAPAALWQTDRCSGRREPDRPPGAESHFVEAVSPAPRHAGTGAGGGESRRILAGRDLVAGGTWLGVTADGRFAAITNYRGAAAPRADAPSRGGLAVEYLRGGLGARAHAREAAREAHHYSGFSLLLADRDELFCVTNRGEEAVTEVADGCHGLSNQRLNAPWPKVTGGVRDLRGLLAGAFALEDLFSLLSDEDASGPPESGSTGHDRADSVRFIRNLVYGTRSSTVVTIDRSGAIAFEERSYDAHGVETGRVAFRRPAGEEEGFSLAPVPLRSLAAAS